MGASKIINPATAGGLPPAGVFGTGSINTLAKFTGATTIANSGISDDGATVSFVARNLASTALQTTWTLPSDASALTLGGVLTLNTSQKRLGINCAPGTLLSVSDGIVSAPSYEGIRLGNTSEALFSSSDSIRGFRAGVTGSTVVVGSSTSHDLLLQRNNVTALTLGASGVTFAGNLTSSAAQTWTLAAGSTSALNIQSGLLNLDTTNSRVGIGTASPQEKLQVYGNLKVGVLASGSYISLADESTSARSSGIFRLPGYYVTGVGGSSGIMFTTGTGGLGSQTEQMRIDATGNVGIGTASPTGRLHVVGGTAAAATNGAPVTIIAQSAGTGNQNGGNIVLTPGALSGSGSAGVADLSGPTGTGLKLPATPGNADSQTLDAYNQNTTWAPTVTWGTGGTVTTTSATGAYTQIGNVVTFTVTIAYNCSVIPTGGSVTIDLPRASATGFNQRPGMWAFNAFNGTAGTNFLSIGSGSTTANLRVATATGTADVAVNLTVTASGALVVTCTYLAS